jgi:hypothetical protein
MQLSKAKQIKDWIKIDPFDPFSTLYISTKTYNFLFETITFESFGPVGSHCELLPTYFPPNNYLTIDQAPLSTTSFNLNYWSQI